MKEGLFGANGLRFPPTMLRNKFPSNGSCQSFTSYHTISELILLAFSPILPTRTGDISCGSTRIESEEQFTYLQHALVSRGQHQTSDYGNESTFNNPNTTIISIATQIADGLGPTCINLPDQVAQTEVNTQSPNHVTIIQPFCLIWGEMVELDNMREMAKTLGNSENLIVQLQIQLQRHT